MVKLSACVIVKNEEKNISVWLEHMRQITKEMIVVDTGSEDRTVELAKAAGAKTYFYAWNNDFAAAKNYAISKATGSWILFLDADEYFSDESMRRLQGEMEKHDKNRQLDGILCNLVNIDAAMDNRVISTGYQMRIFRNRKYLRYTSKIHEYVTNLAKKYVTRLFVDLVINHTGYSTDIVKDKMRRNLRMLQDEIAVRGRKTTDYGYLIDCYYGLDDYEKTIKCVEEAFAADEKNEEQLSTIYRRWIDSLITLQRDEAECLAAVDQAIAAFPYLPEFLWNKAEHYLRCQDFQQSESYIEKALALHADNEKTGRTLDKNAFDALLGSLYYTQGNIFRMKNDIARTVEAYIESLKKFRYRQLVFKALYELVSEWDTVEVIQLFSLVYENNERDNKFIYDCLRVYRNALTLFYEKRLRGTIQEQDAEHAMAAGKYVVAAEYLAAELDAFYRLGIACAEQDNGRFHVELEVLLPVDYRKDWQEEASQKTAVTEESSATAVDENPVETVANEASIEEHAEVESQGAEPTCDIQELTSIIILSYNTLEITKSCIESVRQWTTDTSYELIVVDNGSTDGSAAWLAAQPDIQCIFNKENKGFPAGCNQGLALACGTDILYLNSDTVVTPRWLRQLKTALHSAERVGAVGCVTNSCANFQQIDVSYGKSREALFAFAESFNHSDPQKWERRLKLVGFCLLVKRSAQDEAGGGFDELFSPGNFEDDDLCERLREAGYELLLCRDTFIHHFGSMSFRQTYGDIAFAEQEKRYYGLIEKNWQIFRKKWDIREENMNAFRDNQCKEEVAFRIIEQKWGSEHLPLVSVMIPTYNRAELFVQTLQSVRRQTYPNIEIIVCDNSTDERTAELMQQYTADPRIQYHRNRDAKTKAENFQPFEQLAKGDFLQWLMDDDLLEPEKTTRMLAAFAENDQVKLATSNRCWIDIDGNDLGNPLLMEMKGTEADYAVLNGQSLGEMMLHDSVNYIGEPSAVLFRRADLKHHYWQADCRGYTVISDVVMWLELLETGNCAYFKRPLSSYRRHAGQEGQSADVVLRSRIEWFRINAECYAAGKFYSSPQEFKEALEKLERDETVLFDHAYFLAHPEIKELPEWQEYQEVLRTAKELIQCL